MINEETAQSRAVSSDVEGTSSYSTPARNLFAGRDGRRLQEVRTERHHPGANERFVVRKVTLEVGDVNQTVTITAEAPNVQTESAERGD